MKEQERGCLEFLFCVFLGFLLWLIAKFLGHIDLNVF